MCINLLIVSKLNWQLLQWHVWLFYDRMTVHRDRFRVNKTNRCTEFQFCCYYDSTCFGQPFCPSSGVLSHPTPGSKRSSQLHKMYQSRCTAKNSRWWTERLPETCRVVIAIKLEFSAFIGFIHKESVSLYYAVNNPTQTTTDHKPSHCTSAQSSERSRVRRSIRLFI